MTTIHLIPNAHLDPVWLWDWRDGLNEGLATCRTILNLMDEFPDLTFIRGEATIYEHVERHDPDTFARIRKMVDAGRWDVVGGSMIQPDTNMPHTRTFERHYELGQRYFQSRFGRPVRAAWAADSFGHSAGLPDILHRAGLSYFACTRPPQDAVSIDKPAFWWQGVGGATLLTYRPRRLAYCCERGDMAARFQETLNDAKDTGLENLAMFFGLGNHGGGPTRRHILDIQTWIKEHPEVRVVFSHLHGLFAALEKEIAQKGRDFLPTHVGEMNHCLRGCYASAAKLKFAYRRAEAGLIRAEKTCGLIDRSLSRPATSLEEPWRGLLFNSFHDILPGSSIERALDEQIQWLGGVQHQARTAEFEAVNDLARTLDTRVPKPADDCPCAVPQVLVNPHDHAFDDYVEIEAALDHRPLFEYSNRWPELPVRLHDGQGRDVPFQVILTEHRFYRHVPWRCRVLAKVHLPAKSWGVYSLGYVPGAAKPAGPQAAPATSPKPGTIDNGLCRVEATVGELAVKVHQKWDAKLDSEGLSAGVYHDPYGSWGDFAESEEAAQLTRCLETWRVTQVEMIETGPHRAAMWVRLSGHRSWIDLTFHVLAGMDRVQVHARVRWNEQSARLKLTIPGSFGEADFDVPGGIARRKPCGQTPGGRWVRGITGEGKPSLGVITDSLYNFATQPDALTATVCRATRYADDYVVTHPLVHPWQPMVDAGELLFQMILAPGSEDLAKLALNLEQPILVQTVPARPAQSR
ncbi:MAG: glycoside hydrolase family 38 [Phycisphaeraceae bacterium]|nr:glycoside hydrolase family 38 [Phycisphaeraceae bacterium]